MRSRSSVTSLSPSSPATTQLVYTPPERLVHVPAPVSRVMHPVTSPCRRILNHLPLTCHHAAGVHGTRAPDARPDVPRGRRVRVRHHAVGDVPRSGEKRENKWCQDNTRIKSWHGTRGADVAAYTRHGTDGTVPWRGARKQGGGGRRVVGGRSPSADEVAGSPHWQRLVYQRC